MSNETDWDELSDEYTEHTPAIIGETIRPQRAITMDDIDDIFAGRPPRRPAPPEGRRALQGIPHARHGRTGAGTGRTRAHRQERSDPQGTGRIPDRQSGTARDGLTHIRRKAPEPAA